MRTQVAIVMTATAALVMTGASANADGPNDTDRLAATVAAVEPNHGPQIGFSNLAAAGTNSDIQAPNSADGAITVADADISVGISLPTNVALADADEAADGTVVYAEIEGDGGVVVEALQDGSVQLQSIIAGPESEHDITYELTVSDGARLEIVETGAVVVWAADGTFEAGLATPWAVDADGESIETTFSLSGTTVTQHVADASTYPVTADPWLGIALIDTVTRTYYAQQGYRYHVYPTWWGRGGAGIAARKAAWTEAKAKGVGIPQYLTLMNQFYCHYDYRPITTFKGSWNLESWKNDKGYGGWITSKCN